MTETTKALRGRYKKKAFPVEVKLRNAKGDVWKEIKQGADPLWFDCCMYRKMRMSK